MYFWYTMSKGEKFYSIIKKQKVRESTRKKIFYIFSSSFFVNNFYTISIIMSNKKQKFLWGNQDITNKKTKKWTVNVLNPNKQQNIHQFQGEYRISGALNVLLPKLHLSFTQTKNKEQQGRIGLSQLLLGCMHSAINT